MYSITLAQHSLVISGPFRFTAQRIGVTVPQKDWSNVPALVNSSDLIGQKNRSTENGGILFLLIFRVAR